MIEIATCENCDNFDNCPVVQFESPETCGNYEGDYEIQDLRDCFDIDEPINFYDNDSDFDIMSEMP
jgi:hypothetical protein